MNLIKCENVLGVSNRDKKKNLYNLKELIDQSVIVDHVDKEPIRFNEEGDLINNKNQKIKMCQNSPIMLPHDIKKNYENMKLKDIIKISDPIIQYQVLSFIKGSGQVVDVNADKSSISYNKHLYRMKLFLSNVTGDILDIGCDDISSSLKIIPPVCKYLGLDVFVESSEHFKIFGVAEMLPFANNSFYNVLFNASLDHILDYHEAISEAFRVLKKNGYIYISSYVWKEKATLLKDIIHFHHFRDEQLLSSVENYFNISEVLRYECPKNNNHRYQLFIKAQKKNEY